MTNHAGSGLPKKRYFYGRTPTGNKIVLVQPVTVPADEPYVMDASGVYCWRAQSQNGKEINLRLTATGQLLV